MSMRRPDLREPRRGEYKVKRWPYKRRNDPKRERADRALTSAGWRYLIEVLSFSVLALAGAALFLDLPLFHVRPIALTWDELAKARYVRDDASEALQLQDTTVKLNKRPVALRGFVTLLEEGNSTTHFVLGSKQPDCPRCFAPGSQQVEVFSSTPIPYSPELLIVSGRLSPVPGTTAHLAYQLLDAKLVQR